MGDNELKIVIEATLDEVKSLQNLVAGLKQLQSKIKSHKFKVLAGLDKDASARQIKSDLAQITKTKGRVKIVGEMDNPATKKNVDVAIKNLKNTEIKLTGVLDSSATQRNVEQQLGQIPKVETTANVNVSGGDEVDKLRNQMDNAGVSAAGMAAQLYVARSALQLLRRTAIEAKEIIIELDSAATDLALATGSHSEEAYRLLEQYNALAKRLGATTSQVAEGATEWLRQGRSAAETTALLEQSMILSKVGAMSADEATKNLTSTMKGFKLEVDDVAGVVDRLTAIDLKAAVTSADLATAVARTANSANLAGVGLDKLLGYIAVVEETTQKSAETIGESFKTIFARMGNVKLGKFLDDDGEDLSDTEKILSNFGIALRENNNQFREFDEVLDEVASRWSEFSNVEQSAIATTIAGTRQRENFLVLMQNYGEALEYTGVAADSAGTALEKFEAYESSIEAKSASFVAAVESLTMDTIDSDLVKDLIDGATAVVEFVEAAGLLRATLLSLGAGATLKGVQLIAMGFKDVSQHILNMGEATNILRRVGDVSVLSGEQISRLGTLTKGLSNDQLKLILTSKDLSAAQMKAILMASGLTSAEASQKIQTLGLAASQKTAAGATWSLSSAMNGLKVALLANPIGAIMAAISAATVVISLFTSAWEDAKQKEEEARQKMMEVADAAKEEADAISELYDAYTDANKAYQDGIGSKADLTSATDSLLEALGYEKGAVSGLIDEYVTLEKAIDGVTKKSLEEKAASLLEGYNAAKENALSAAEDSMGWFSGSTIAVKTNGDDRKFAELLHKAGYLGSGDLPALSTSLYTGINNYGGIDSLVEGYEKLLEIKKLLESGIGDGYSAKELSGADVYNDVVAKINAVSDEIEAYKEVMRAHDENQAQIEYRDFVEAHGVPETREEYDALRQSLLDTAEASGKYVSSQNDIEAAITNMLATKPALQAFFTTSAEGVTLYKAQLSDLTDVLSRLQSSHNALDAARADMAAGGGLSPDTIEKLASAEENYLDYLYEENGVVKLNTEAWKENANAKMQNEMDEIQKEIHSLEERNKVLQQSVQYYEEQRNIGYDGGIWTNLIAKSTSEMQANNAAIAENQGKLAVYSGLYGSITGELDAYTSAMQNWTIVSSTIDTITSSFQTLANLQAEVANGFTMSLDKALEFAKVYPQILDSAKVTADGQISLNEGVVNSFIEGKKTELDAQIDAMIADLEAEKAKDEAKLASAKAQLELAKSVGEGEGQISKETAEYRINVGNAMTSALIDMGVDQATAYSLAAAAMAENQEEFARVAKGAFENMDDNAAKAAYNMAHAIFVNARNSCESISDITKQVHGMAMAISAAGNGEVAGFSGNRFSGLNGSKVSGLSLDLYHGDFKGSDYDYDSKTIGLDDYVSQLELDISSYQDAIAQIDGQIAALEALKNLPLESFKSGKGSGGSGGGGGKGSGGNGGTSGTDAKTKEVEEYIASVDEYRNAVERLRKAQERVEGLETQTEDAGSYEEKIRLEEELIKAYQKEQDTLHDLNDLRDGTIQSGVASLRALGFAVQYNADTNELWIENLEHLNELQADSQGEYDTMQEATNALRKDTEELINTLTDLNEENREGSATWKKLQKSILDATVAISESKIKLRENTIALNENWFNDAVSHGNMADAKKYTDDMVALYRDIQDAKHEEAKTYRDAGYSDTSDEVSQLSDDWWELEESIRDATQAYYDSVKAFHENKLTMNENWFNDAVSRKNSGEVKRYANEMVAAYQAIQDVYHQEAEEIRASNHPDLERLNELSDGWWDLKDKIEDVKQSVVDYFIDMVDAASDAVDEIQNVSDTLHEAADESAAHDGYMSIDTWQKLRDIGLQYMQLLEDENGAYEFNEERINAVIAARTRQMAVENAMSYVERIKLATQEGAIEKLNDLIFVTTDATNSTWGLVYANLALLDLSDAQYEAALKNINAMRSLADNAIEGIGKTGKALDESLDGATGALESTKEELQELLDTLEDMQGGANDFLDIVMEYVEHKVRQQIQMLEDMKDAYSDIIDLKKKSLEATKSENDYQKDIAQKVKELAKLQSKVDVLSLDTSRDAQAKKASALEEMAALQEELADSQEEHSLEAQKDALDQANEKYAAQKDAEIEILEDSISSKEKIYQKALKLIQEEWDTLYDQLISYNTEYGSQLNREITEAWEAAQNAAQRYGDFVSAINNGIEEEIRSITEQIEGLEEQIAAIKDKTNEDAHNVVVGASNQGYNQEAEQIRSAAVPIVNEMKKNSLDWFTAHDRTAQEATEAAQQILRDQYANVTSDDVQKVNGTWYSTSGSPLYTLDKNVVGNAIVSKMKQNSGLWASMDETGRSSLAEENAELGSRLGAYLGQRVYRDHDGVWWIGDDRLFDVTDFRKYHTGGVAGDQPTLKQKEVLAVLEKGEAILDKKKEDGLYKMFDMIDFINLWTKKVEEAPDELLFHSVPASAFAGGLLNNCIPSQAITNNQGPSIHFGDVHITGANHETVKQHIEVNRRFVNDVLEHLNLKR